MKIVKLLQARKSGQGLLQRFGIDQGSFKLDQLALANGLETTPGYGPPAKGTGIMGQDHQIPGQIAEQDGPPAVQMGQGQMALLPVRNAPTVWESTASMKK